MLRELVFQYSKRESGAVHGYIHFLQQERYRSDMILMTVRQHESADAFRIFLQVGSVRYDQIDSEHIVVRKDTPQSTTMISSPYSYAVILRPI